ncbi:hypothetical protein E4U41_004485 [Claviceps citrina]|nr:hypothetical protein E4U41_004485 [Claviceps citrina]
MDQSYNPPGSVKRAREQAQGMLYRDGQSRGAPPSMTATAAETAPRSRRPPPQLEPQSRPAMGMATNSADSRSGQTISRPKQVAQWPLVGSSAPPPVHAEAGLQAGPRAGPQARHQQMPQRPPRPSQSRIPSILEKSRPQQPTPVFTSRAIAPDCLRDSATVDSYDVSSPSDSSARQTTSTVGTIPEPQAPAQVDTSSASMRKNAALGPPPSSRRGASSFYSSASDVSPIPEETPRMKHLRSHASSAATPEPWRGEPPRTHSPAYGEPFYEESLTEKSPESTYDDYGDESQLVRSASLGKKGKPALINTKSPGLGATNPKNGTFPLQTTAENDQYLSAGTSSSETIPTSRNVQKSHRHATNGESISSDAILKAFAAASSSDVKESIPLADAPRQHSRLSAMRRPPRLDMDAVRAAEARGSLTSLPDLILRATRLAAMIDKGKRPASRLDMLDGSMDEKDDRHKSGFSDMLAAFPPPLHTPRNNNASRSSWFRGGIWPTAQGQDRPTHSRSPSGQIVPKPKRLCCGLPMWAFILSIFVLLCLIAAAIVIPLEFFVFKNLGNNSDKPETSLSQCQNSLTCLNGGTSLYTQGRCSCICTNGFTGSACGDGGATGCAMTDLVSTDGQSNIQNVTLGRAIPRLIADANRNYSVPLSGTTILARLNAGNLSCLAQNSLVTFDGRPSRLGQATDKVEPVSGKQAISLLNAEELPPISTITFTPMTDATLTTPADGHDARMGADTRTPTLPALASAITPTSGGISSAPDAVMPTTLVIDTGSTAPDAPGSPFEVTEERVDFARVAMLYILQEGSVDKAISAQSEVQQLLDKVTRSKKERGVEVSNHEASNVDLGSGYSMNMVDLSINVGKEVVGRGKMKAKPSL